MSHKRGQDHQQQRPRAIVKRRAGVGGHREQPAGAPPRTIVRRHGAGVHAPPPPRRRLRDRIAWRPGRRLRITFFAVVGFAVVGGIAAWAAYSPYFKVGEVTVTGTENIPPEVVVERAGLIGESIFSADLNAAQRAIYELPLVASAKIERSWPDRIVVTIQERQAWGTWEQGSVAYTIDRQGVVLGAVPPPEDAPVIRSSQAGSRQQGDRVDYQAVEAAAAIYELLPGALGTEVAEVAYSASRGLVVTTENGQVGVFGDSSSIRYKLSVWAALAAEAQARHISYTTIDLRYGNRPVLQ